MQSLFNLLRRTTLIIVTLVISANAYALDLELTKGVKTKMPLTVLPFTWVGQKASPPLKIAAVVRNDLLNSGRFDLRLPKKTFKAPKALADVDFAFWRNQKVNALLIGQLQSQGRDQYQLHYVLVDLFRKQDQLTPKSADLAALNPDNNPVIAKGTMTVSATDLRKSAHIIANKVYHAMLGEPGFFLRKIAYIQKQAGAGDRAFQLVLADYDGFNANTILMGANPIMSPSFSKDGKRLAYVSFESKTPSIYIQNLKDHSRQLIAHYPGVNGAPAFSPDGKTLALALSKNGATNLYLLNLQSKQLTQLTRDWSTDTSPAFSPDGKSLAFASDRSGTLGLYQLDIATQKTTPLTNAFGLYNSDPVYTPDGEQLIFTHLVDGAYHIASLDLASQEFHELTSGLNDQSPTISPNGYLVLYTSDSHRGITLKQTSIEGDLNHGLPVKSGSVSQPAWGMK